MHEITPEEKTKIMSDLHRAASIKYAEIVTGISATMLSIMVVFMDDLTLNTPGIYFLLVGWTCFAITILLGSAYLRKEISIAENAKVTFTKGYYPDEITSPKYYTYIGQYLPKFFCAGIGLLFIYGLIRVVSVSDSCLP